MSALRLLPVVVRALLAPASPPTALTASVLRLRVLPSDLDTNMHMNNGRYLSMMDLGRFDLLVRAGLHRPLLRLRWTPLVGSATIRFRRSLRPFQRYDLRTRVLCWDDKWFIFEQKFESEGGLSALGLVRALFRGRNGNVPPAEALRAGGIDIASPPFPDYVRAWTQSDDEATAAALEQAAAST
ncbi:MAG TPA: thioesterase family protein [Polyangia bacterium]|jgi:acyl-CoA thioesterase FadM|nr:thioesterase family protein [Polyangia bacterium]